MDEEKYITVGLLAGAYFGGGKWGGTQNKERPTLTHSLNVNFDGGGDGFTLCGRIKADHTCDSGGFTKEELAAPPTCKTCLRRDSRFTNPTHHD